MTTHAVVVLGAGQGSRMRSSIPKILHPVCGREMISLVLDTTRTANFDSTVVVLAPDSQAVRETIGKDVEYAVQQERLGTAHALLQSRPLLQSIDTVTVLCGDVPLIRPETLRSMAQYHIDQTACITLLTTTGPSANDMGSIIRDKSGVITRIMEKSDPNYATRATTELNAGAYCINTAWLWPNLETLEPSPSGEFYLTDLIAVARQQEMKIVSLKANDPEEALGINTRVQLALAEAILRRRIRDFWMLSGVTMSDPASVYIDAGSELGQDTIILPNTHILGKSSIGQECEIGPNSIVSNSQVGDRCKIVASFVDDSILENNVTIGPFGRIRPDSYLEKGVHLGNFTEVTRSRLGRGSRSGHFSYIGDAEVGANVNIGAGTVTCNYDGISKHKTRIKDEAFIGSGSMLVAPVEVGNQASTGAGTVVTRNIPPKHTAVGIPAKSKPKRQVQRQD